MTSPPRQIGPIFFTVAGTAVDMMRQHGMNDSLIACILTEVRSAALIEEEHRLDALRAHNPPYHAPWPEVRGAIEPSDLATSRNG